MTILSLNFLWRKWRFVDTRDRSDTTSPRVAPDNRVGYNVAFNPWVDLTLCKYKAARRFCCKTLFETRNLKTLNKKIECLGFLLNVLTLFVLIVFLVISIQTKFKQKTRVKLLNVYLDICLSYNIFSGLLPASYRYAAKR